jgi:hypothetical protein
MWEEPDAQGSPISSYSVFMDSDGNTNDDYYLVATVNEPEFLVASGIMQGLTHKFKIIATNQMGQSTASDPGIFLAASPPAAPEAPLKQS